MKLASVRWSVCRRIFREDTVDVASISLLSEIEQLRENGQRRVGIFVSGSSSLTSLYSLVTFLVALGKGI